MNKGLDLIKRRQLEFINDFPTGNISIGVTKEELTELENELKDYQEIKEIAKRYNWDSITSEIFNVKTDRKYRDLFDSAIVSIQEDYRKARAFEIIKEKKVNVSALLELDNLQQYNDYCDMVGGCKRLTQEEYDSLKEAML